jgi:threonine dehydratase
MRFLWERMKLVVEPTGAMGLAAVHSGCVPFASGARIGVILSGGNVDLAQAAEWFGDRAPSTI